MAHLPVADHAGEIGERRDRFLHRARGGDLGVAHHRADHHSVAFRLERFQVADRIQVDQVRGRRQSQLHRLHQALAAGEELALALLAGEGDRVFHAGGSVILECVHGFS